MGGAVDPHREQRRVDRLPELVSHPAVLAVLLDVVLDRLEERELRSGLLPADVAVPEHLEPELDGALVLHPRLVEVEPQQAVGRLAQQRLLPDDPDVEVRRQVKEDVRRDQLLGPVELGVGLPLAPLDQQADGRTRLEQRPPRPEQVVHRRAEHVVGPPVVRVRPGAAVVPRPARPLGPVPPEAPRLPGEAGPQVERHVQERPELLPRQVRAGEDIDDRGAGAPALRGRRERAARPVAERADQCEVGGSDVIDRVHGAGHQVAGDGPWHVAVVRQLVRLLPHRLGQQLADVRPAARELALVVVQQEADQVEHVLHRRVHQDVPAELLVDRVDARQPGPHILQVHVPEAARVPLPQPRAAQPLLLRPPPRLSVLLGRIGRADVREHPAPELRQHVHMVAAVALRPIDRNRQPLVAQPPDCDLIDQQRLEQHRLPPFPLGLVLRRERLLGVVDQFLHVPEQRVDMPVQVGCEARHVLLQHQRLRARCLPERAGRVGCCCPPPPSAAPGRTSTCCSPPGALPGLLALADGASTSGPELIGGGRRAGVAARTAPMAARIEGAAGPRRGGVDGRLIPPPPFQREALLPARCAPCREARRRGGVLL
eukprot:SAG22_NODE_133_length_18379_cov_34.571937_3_plen_600_part_00